jgi:ketosteroid isomerase-like protein
MGSNVETVAKGWGFVAEGNWEALCADYHEDMTFIMPGQTDVIEGVGNFRSALEKLGEVVPPGFEILELEHFESEGQNVVTVAKWKCAKIPDGTWCSIMFAMRDGKVQEERWFIDTEQWKAAF